MILFNVAVACLVGFFLEIIFSYYDLLGCDLYSTSPPLEEHETGACRQKYENVTENQFKWPIKNSLDADVLESNGLAIIIRSNEFPFIDNSNDGIRNMMLNGNRNDVFMLDMNQIEESTPLPMEIVLKRDKKTQVPPDYFNFFAVSIYEDRRGAIKLLMANYITDSARLKFTCLNRTKQEYSIEKFEYDHKHHRLIYVDSFREALGFGQLCDLVAIDDSIFYFTKCFSNTFAKKLQFGLKFNTGQIWLYNLHKNLVYQVASRLFMPKAIAYIRDKSLIVTTNLAVNGLTIFKRADDNSLTRLRDIELSKFVFNINIDANHNLWLTTHTTLHKTMKIVSNAMRVFPNEDQTSRTQLLKLTLNFKTYQRIATKEFFAYNGTSYNALSSSLAYNRNLVLFSLIKDPRVCSLIV